MNNVSKITYLFVILILGYIHPYGILASAVGKKYDDCAGCPEELSKNHPKIREIIELVKKSITGVHPSKIRVVVQGNPTSQVVAGTLYKFKADIIIREPKQTKENCVVTAWYQEWVDRVKPKELKVDCPSGN